MPTEASVAGTRYATTLLSMPGELTSVAGGLDLCQENANTLVSCANCKSGS